MNLKKKLKSIQCRTCFQAKKSLKLLTKLATDGKEPPKSYAELLKEVTNINIMDDKSQELTKFICGCCSRKLKAAHDFVQQAQEANEKLLAMLNQEYDSNMLDCLQESQVDIPSCLEIKMEHDIDERGGQEATKCEVKLKLEDSEEIILANKPNMDILNTKKDEETIEMNTLKENNDKNCSDSVVKNSDSEENEDILNMTTTKRNIDISDYEDNDEDNFSEDYEWQEKIKSSTTYNKIKKNITSKSYKPKADTDDVEDIAVPCNQCNKIFSNSKALACHQRNTHIPEEQKCSCPVCGHKFTRSCNMYKHMRILHGPESVTAILKPSTKERTHQCDKCPCKYTKKSHLNCHMKAKHSNKNEDGKDKSTESLPNDNKTERYKKPFLCSICGGSFSSKTHLTVHMRRHTGERPFKCDFCDRAFHRISELSSHRRTHTGERPYSCTVCGRSFTQSNSLKTHRTKLGHME